MLFEVARSTADEQRTDRPFARDQTAATGFWVKPQRSLLSLEKPVLLEEPCNIGLETSGYSTLEFVSFNSPLRHDGEHP